MIVNPVHIFYENNAFENLKETKPFLNYLEVEKRKVGEAIRGGRALDIGCGNGRSTEVIADVVDEVPEHEELSDMDGYPVICHIQSTGGRIFYRNG